VQTICTCMTYKRRTLCHHMTASVTRAAVVNHDSIVWDGLSMKSFRTSIVKNLPEGRALIEPLSHLHHGLTWPSPRCVHYLETTLMLESNWRLSMEEFLLPIKG
jgi:hypothetical protein